MILGDMIKDLREDNNYSQKDLADILHISISCLSKYETNRTQPPLELIIKIADTFNISVDYLIGRNCCKFDYNELKRNYTKNLSGFALINDLMSLDAKRRKTIIDLLQDIKRCNDYDKIKPR